jgi:ubiquinol-cytochrome c reductase cytochrome b subunit
MRLISIPVISILHGHIIDYPTPTSINYFWGFGSLAGLCLVFQIITGICLAMHYTPHVLLAFDSVEHITRDVKNGWMIRYMHANGASIFFMMVYVHMGRGVYFKSYRNIPLWSSGVAIFFLMIGIAFMGYVCVWGQMSFWGATVITNLASAIPKIGDNIAKWLWGGFSIDNATLNRLFSLHYLLPFILAGISLIHLVFLHLEGSTTPLGVCSKMDKISFYPYFVYKDLFGFFAILITIFSVFIFFAPNYLNHPDNYIKANPLVTPTHIVPEWYLLTFYAILRSIPDKLGGVVCMAAAILIFLLLPFVGQFKIKSPKFNKVHQFFFWSFISNALLLLWLGAQLVEEPFVTIGQVATIFYFMYFFLILPFLSYLENKALSTNK